ncbi:MAG TPA: hypothetical protein DGP39_05015, partial [Verrucomicrobiales bacterium]|nr:hypothetical protein [Verrucomicrobiales bacterium]
MPITINRDGENFGPYTTEEVRDLLANGTLKEDDLAHEEGTEGWVPLRSLPGLQTTAPIEAEA